MSALLEGHREDLRIDEGLPPSGIDLPGGSGWGEDDRSARRSLRAQIAKLERELSDTFVTAFPMGGLGHEEFASAQPRLLDLGELEQTRDMLAARLRHARAQISERADMFEHNRVRLERMLLEPAKHRGVRISLADLGERGCGAYEVKPRLGVIGMLAGWWHVKISSGCPLAGGRGERRGPASDTPRRRALIASRRRIASPRGGDRSAGCHR